MQDPNPRKSERVDFLYCNTDRCRRTMIHDIEKLGRRVCRGCGCVHDEDKPLKSGGLPCSPSDTEEEFS